MPKTIAPAFVAVLVAAARSPGQAPLLTGDNPLYPHGIVLGLSVSQTNYKTFWTEYVFTPDLDTAASVLRPIHNHPKTEVSLYMENRALLSGGGFYLDARGQVSFGVYGQSEQRYLPDSLPRVISSGGTSFGGHAVFKLAYPLQMGVRSALAPYAGGGLSFVLLQPNGAGLAPIYQRGAYRDLAYKDGWTEFTVLAPVVAGFSLEFEKFVLAPEARYLAWGQANTDWQPTEPRPKPDKLEYWSAGIILGFRMRR